MKYLCIAEEGLFASLFLGQSVVAQQLALAAIAQYILLLVVVVHLSAQECMLCVHLTGNTAI